MTWDDIPDYIETEDSELRYYLTISKSFDGQWVAAYTAHLFVGDDARCNEHEAEHVQTIIGLNDFTTLDEIPPRLYYAIERYKKRGGFDSNQEVRKVK